MEHFNHEEDDNVIYVPTELIAISKPIINAVKSNNGVIKKGTKIDPNAPTFGKLERLGLFNFLEDILPPVKLKCIGKYYVIIDGRHRVALSIIHNMKYVPVTLY